MNRCTSVFEALAQARSHIDARIETEILLAHILKKDRAFLFAHPEAKLSPAELAHYQVLIAERVKGMPIAYIIGYRPFWSLTLKVTPDTLIPRHETERLVEIALESIPNEPHQTLLDLGTGSGAVALAIAKERPTWMIDATDFCPKALEVAQENARRHNITNIHFYLSDWFLQLPLNRYHAIVSNPPYIPIHDEHISQGDVRFEPQSALVSGEDGLESIRHIIKYSVDFLHPEGLLLLEHGYCQKNKIMSILSQLGYQNIKCWKDYLGHDRVSGGIRPITPNE
jgi:release factor glutamine methyltransferase